MVTQITLGNFFNANGKTVLGGVGGSGLDTEALIKGLTEAKALPATQKQDQITLNDKKSAALTTLQTLLSDFKSASDALRNPPGVGNDADNVFKFTSSAITSNTAIPGGAYVSASTSPGASLQSYTISDITSLATSGRQTSGVFTVASATANVVPPASGNVAFKAGTFSLNGHNITIDSGDSLAVIAAKFNAQSDNTGVAATVIQISSNQFQLSFVATKTGTDNDFDLANQLASSVTDASHVLGGIGLTAATTQQSGIFTVASADDDVVPPASGSVQFAAGTITIKGQDITINAGDSLNVIAGKFQAVSATTGLNASVVNVAPGQYKLLFTAANTGTGNEFDLRNTDYTTVTDPSSVLANLGFAAPVKGASNAVAGTNASFKINDIAITRQSNSVSDLISGVTFNLLQQTPDSDTEVTVAIQPDRTTTQNSIVNFINAYNALKKFEAQQSQLKSDGTYADDAVLANSTTFRNIMSDINARVTSAVSGLSGITSLADIGITFINQSATDKDPAVSNILNVDDGKLTTALANSFSDINKLFGFTLTSDNPNIKVFERGNQLNVTDFTLTIDPLHNTYTASYTTDAGPQTATFTAQALSNNAGYRLTGGENTPFAGLVLLYGSTAAATITMKTTQGIADKVYNTANSALTSNTGSLAVELQALKDSDTRLNDDITKINTQVDEYRQSLLNRFAALEQALSRVNTLLQSLDAQQQAANNS